MAQELRYRKVWQLVQALDGTMVRSGLFDTEAYLVDIEIVGVDAIEQEAIDNLTVTTIIGVWKADETSQDRMSNAIAQLSRKPLGTTKKWKMYDKSKVDVVQADIEEAFDLAVAELDAIVMA